MTVYITKFVFSYGIFEAKVLTCFPNSDLIEVSFISSDSLRYGVSGSFNTLFCRKPDWWFTPQEALTRAEEMKREHISFLNLELQKIKNLQFSELNIARC